MRRPHKAQASHQLIYLRLLQAGQFHRLADNIFPLEARNRFAQTLICLYGSVGGDDQDRQVLVPSAVREGKDQVGEQLQRRRVGPVQVIDDESEGASL